MSKWKTADNPPTNQSNVLILWQHFYAMWWYYQAEKQWMWFTYEWTQEFERVTHWRELPKYPNQ